MVNLRDKGGPSQPPFLRPSDSDQQLNAAPESKDHQKGGKARSFAIRTGSTVVLIGGFLFFLWAGHVPLMCLVLLLQTLMVREVFNLGRMEKEDEKLPGFRALQWYFFWVATFYLYLRFITNNLLVEITSTQAMAKLFSTAVKRHVIISYALYCAGFVAFVLSLKRGLYRYQFSQFGWTHQIILVVIMPTSFFVSNTFSGIIWYLLPATLIIVNDIFAYLFGFFLGRTPLIQLSPKKTWEGFIGAFFSTLIFAYYASRTMAGFKWLTCPRRDLSLGPLDCNPGPIFHERAFKPYDIAIELPGPLEELLALAQALLPSDKWDAFMSSSVTTMPVQLHACVMSVFASLISPFGGFFASGFKRAFKMKDFGDTIPGHGGITDRFDCQVLMAIFSYLYYQNYVFREEPSIANVLAEAIRLPNTQQIELFQRLANLLAAQRLLPEAFVASISNVTGLSN